MIERIPDLLWGWLGSGILLGSLLAGLTWLLARVMGRRLPPAVEAALWAVVLLRFVIPSGPACSLSMPSLLRTIADQAPLASRVVGLGEANIAEELAFGPPTSAVEPTGLLGSDRGIGFLLGALYIGTVSWMAVIRIRRYRRFRVWSRSLPPAQAGVLRLVDRTRRRLGVKHRLEVRVADGYPAPCITGFFRPLLILSRPLLSRPDELETVVVHEISHLRRGDLAVRCLQWIAGTLLYFWPVVIWVNRRIDSARERACDQWALRFGKLSAGDYARCLIRALPLGTVPVPAHRPASMAGRISNIERRIDMILDRSDQLRRRPFWGLAALGLVVVWSAFALTGAVDAGSKSKVTSSEIEEASRQLKSQIKTVVGLVGEYPSADVNQDGEIQLPERTAFLMAVFLADPAGSVSLFPYADHLKPGEVDFWTAYEVVRGIPYLHDLKEQVGPELDRAKKADDKEEIHRIKMLHEAENLRRLQVILGAQESLARSVDREPPIKKIHQIHQQILPKMTPKKMDEVKKLKQLTWELEQKAAQAEEDGDLAMAEKLRQKLEQVKQKLSNLSDK